MVLKHFFPILFFFPLFLGEELDMKTDEVRSDNWSFWKQKKAGFSAVVSADKTIPSLKVDNVLPHEINCVAFWALQWALVSCGELHSKGGGIQRKMMPALVPRQQSNCSTLTTVPTRCLLIPAATTCLRSRSVLHIDWK